jgi:hypothetical protein
MRSLAIHWNYSVQAYAAALEFKQLGIDITQRGLERENKGYERGHVLVSSIGLWEGPLGFFFKNIMPCWKRGFVFTSSVGL